jgi:hypothetical protein
MVVNTAFGLWTFAGLETPLFTFLLLAALTAHWYEVKHEAKWPVPSAMVLVLAALTRPDGVIVWGVIAAWKLLAAIRRDLRPVALLIWAACFLVPFAAYWCWRWSYYGEFFPNTFYLKSGSGSEFYERGARYVSDFVVVYWVWLTAAAIVSVVKELRERYQPATCGLSLLLVWLAYVVGGGGDWMPYFRFLVPVLPLVYLLALNGAIDGVEMAGRRITSDVAVAAIAAFAAVLVFSSVRPFDSPRAKDPSGFNEGPLPGAVDLASQGAIGLWMKENIPNDYTIAQIATGIVPYYSELPTLDMLGVNDAHIAHLDMPVGRGPAGHDKQDGAYVLLSRPEVMWLSIGLEAAPRTTPDDYRPPIDERLAPVVTEVSHNAYLWVFYRPIAIRLGDGWLNLIVRNDVTDAALMSSSP